MGGSSYDNIGSRVISPRLTTTATSRVPGNFRLCDCPSYTSYTYLITTTTLLSAHDETDKSFGWGFEITAHDETGQQGLLQRSVGWSTVLPLLCCTSIDIRRSATFPSGMQRGGAEDDTRSENTKRELIFRYSTSLRSWYEYTNGVAWKTLVLGSSKVPAGR